MASDENEKKPKKFLSIVEKMKLAAGETLDDDDDDDTSGKVKGFSLQKPWHDTEFAKNQRKIARLKRFEETTAGTEFSNRQLSKCARKFYKTEKQFEPYMKKYGKDVIKMIENGETPDADSALAVAGAALFEKVKEAIFLPVVGGAMVAAAPTMFFIKLIRGDFTDSDPDDDDDDDNKDDEKIDPNDKDYIRHQKFANAGKKIATWAGKKVFNKKFKPLAKEAIEKIATFAARCLSFVLKLIGIHIKISKKMIEYIIKELGDEVFNQLANLIWEFDDNSDSEDDGQFILLDCVSILFENNLIGLAFEAMVEEYEWWEWLVMCIVTIANIFLWFVTGGIAFFSKAALAIKKAKNLYDTANEVVEVLELVAQVATD